MAFPLHTPTTEVINVLSGANDAPPGKKVTTSMKLYLRERGQGMCCVCNDCVRGLIARSVVVALRAPTGYSGSSTKASWVYRFGTAGRAWKGGFGDVVQVYLPDACSTGHGSGACYIMG
jgi:hypothetical protein